MDDRKNSIEKDTFISGNNVHLSRSNMTSSLNSLYNNYNIHLKIVKCIGALLMMTLVITTLVITEDLHSIDVNRSKSTDCLRITPKFPKPTIQYNNTSCKTIKSFMLPDDYSATICSLQDKILIHLQEYVQAKPTMTEIYLNIQQWKYLLKIRTHINFTLRKTAQKQRS